MQSNHRNLSKSFCKHTQLERQLICS